MVIILCKLVIHIFMIMIIYKPALVWAARVSRKAEFKLDFLYNRITIRLNAILYVWWVVGSDEPGPCGLPWKSIYPSPFQVIWRNFAWVVLNCTAIFKLSGIIEWIRLNMYWKGRVTSKLQQKSKNNYDDKSDEKREI